MRCFLHADDCGITRSVTEAILACLDAGPLSSASVMTGGTYAREALAALAKRPGVLAGVHLNLLEGAPTAPADKLPELVGDDGLFKHSLGSLLTSFYLFAPRRKKRLLSQIRTELCAQIDLFRASLPEAPLRLDGHLHIHTLPALRKLMRELVREYSPSYVRVPVEPPHTAPAPVGLRFTGNLRRALLAFWSRPLAAMLDEEGVPHNRFLIGALASGSLTLPRLRASLDTVRNAADPDDLVEVMTHPGGITAGEEARQLKKAYRSFYSSPARETEKNLLLSPALAAEFGASLITRLAARTRGEMA